MNTAMAVEKDKGIQPTAPASSPMGSALAFMQAGGNVEQLNQMMDLQDRWEANEARKAFNAAVTAFKANPPKVFRDKENKQYGSRYTSLPNLVNTVNTDLSKHGLNARWDIDQSDQIRVTCILSHVLGHSASVTLKGVPDKSGAKNDLQQIKSTLTYLKGATFEAVTGIASEEGSLDDDGNASGKPIETISEAQEVQINEMLEATGSDKAKFLKWLKTDKISAIPAKSFDNVMATLKQKEKAK